MQESLITGFQSGSIPVEGGASAAGAVGAEAEPSSTEQPRDRRGSLTDAAAAVAVAGTDELDSIPDYLDPNLELAIKLSQEEERRREEERKREEEMLAEVLRLSLEDK